MVLHSRGCGRVARRRFKRWGFPSSILLREPHFFIPSRAFRLGPWRTFYSRLFFFSFLRLFAGFPNVNRNFPNMR